jgi:hypothetical protein
MKKDFCPSYRFSSVGCLTATKRRVQVYTQLPEKVGNLEVSAFRRTACKKVKLALEKAIKPTGGVEV